MKMDLRTHANAARAYAEAIASGDPRRTVELFRDAFRLAAGEMPPAAPDLVRELRASGEDLGGPPLLDDPTFLANSTAYVLDGTRVFGAEPTSSFKDCVAVGTATQWCCTGTLVAPTVVVTAAHCAHLGCQPQRIFIGDDVHGIGRTFWVNRQIEHPEYDPIKHVRDIALLMLNEPAEIKIRRIGTAETLHAQTSVKVVGFGATDATGTNDYGTRRAVDVPLAGWQPWFGADQATEFTAASPLLDRDSCNGDSGGPAYVWADDWYLAGATSRARPSERARCGDGGIYTAVCAYRDWIQQASGVGLA